jgi:hypothetical protein
VQLIQSGEPALEKIPILFFKSREREGDENNKKS